MGPAGVTGSPGLHGSLRGDLPRPGPADVGRPGHPALGEERFVDPHRRANPRRARAFRADVGGPRRVRRHPRLSTAGDRRRIAAWRPGDDRVRDARAQERGGDFHPQPLRGAAWCPAATRRHRGPARCALPASVRPPRRGRHWKVRASSAKATPCGSPPPAVSGSPRRSRPRSWCGRCMRDWRASFACAAIAVAAAACGQPAPPAPQASAPAGLAPVVVGVPAGMGGAPLDVPRRRSCHRIGRCRSGPAFRATAGALGARRCAAGVGSRLRAGPSSDPRRAAGSKHRAARRTEPTARPGLRRFDALRGGEQSDRRFSPTPTARPPNGGSSRRPARCPQPRAWAAPTRTR